MGSEHEAVRRPVTSTRVLVVERDRTFERPDHLVTEEPIEIRARTGSSEPVAVAVAMRTPGNDFELAVGLCLSEGLLRRREDLASVAYCLGKDGVQEYNVVTVDLRLPFDLEAHRRHFVANASCGLCGKQTLDQIEVDCPPVADGPIVARSVVAALPDRLRAAQTVFDATGGLHAAATFSTGGELRVLREDIGRHNALDKVVGNALLADELPLRDSVLLVSGRVSFEIVQKAAIAGIPVLCAVSAPSSLAVAAGQRLGQTVIGFLRGDRFVVYTHPRRIDLDS
ncbi:MAG: formate dehydrogenase accessory sulfurtransferase FdhD [Acidimicrobiia bacterium]